MNSEIKQIHGGTYYQYDEEYGDNITLHVLDQIQTFVEGLPVHLDVVYVVEGGPNSDVIAFDLLSFKDNGHVNYWASVGKALYELVFDEDGLTLTALPIYKDAARTNMLTQLSDLYTVSDLGGSGVDPDAVNALIDARFNNNNGTLTPNDDHLKFDDKVTSPVTSATLDDNGYYNVTYAPGTGVGSTS